MFNSSLIITKLSSLLGYVFPLLSISNENLCIGLWLSPCDKKQRSSGKWKGKPVALTATATLFPRKVLLIRILPRVERLALCLFLLPPPSPLSISGAYGFCCFNEIDPSKQLRWKWDRSRLGPHHPSKINLSSQRLLWISIVLETRWLVSNRQCPFWIEKPIN